MLRIGWFSSGRDKAARDLLRTVQRAIKNGELDAEVCFVFCNREYGESFESDRFLRLVKGYDLPLKTYSYKMFKNERGSCTPSQCLPPWRLDYDREVMKRIEDFDIDIGLLVGYMLIVGEEMCRKYRLLNLHPSIPNGPVGAWEDVVWQLIEEKAEKAGAMIHMVTPELDRGPALTYFTFSLNRPPFKKLWPALEGRTGNIRETPAAKSLFRTIRRYELAREFPLVIATLKSLSHGLIRFEDGPLTGYDLSQEIEDMVDTRYRLSYE